MTQYLLDTNIVLRFSNPSDAQCELVTIAIATLLSTADECYLTPQVLIELWAVATRPVEVNGLGWSSEQTRSVINQLLERFPIAVDAPEIFTHWLTLVTDNQIKGKRVHDARLIALMNAVGISHILTLNPNDFSGIPGITVVQPQDVLTSDDESFG